MTAGNTDYVNLWRVAHDALVEYHARREFANHVRDAAWAKYIAARTAAATAGNQPSVKPSDR